MEIFKVKSELAIHLDDLKNSGQTTGFVATMGALHQGHLELIKASRSQCDRTICSIFVNPTQFNNKEDLQNYPRPVEQDIQKLEEAGCDLLFLPSVDEMYMPGEKWHIDLGTLEHILEGKFRPGHYQGVTQIVKKLFDVIQPDIAFFGQKDYQQFLVISKMCALFNLPVHLVMFPIIRDADGLAMSSRNVRLSEKERRQALALSLSLQMTQEHFGSKPVQQLKEEAIAYLQSQDNVRMEYFEICDRETLDPATDKTTDPVALVAAWVGNTRLIDNILLVKVSLNLQDDY